MCFGKCDAKWLHFVEICSKCVEHEYMVCMCEYIWWLRE